ncbi:RIP homotypic interaction motif-containing protein [Streptomyces sp. NPDC004658]|uniref:RIP homotypic interaction motif-containing protein n=1 Tax=Streptomyces sp. NPDC004658 TaxID=3154672 RepID=UPI0033B46649
MRLFGCFVAAVVIIRLRAWLWTSLLDITEFIGWTLVAGAAVVVGVLLVRRVAGAPSRPAGRTRVPAQPARPSTGSLPTAVTPTRPQPSAASSPPRPARPPVPDALPGRGSPPVTRTTPARCASRGPGVPIRFGGLELDPLGDGTEPSRQIAALDHRFTSTLDAANTPVGQNRRGVGDWAYEEHAEVLTPTRRQPLLVIGCRGVQIGDSNTQFNTYTYRLQDPPLDFSDVLRTPAVRAVLRRLILDPDNDTLRQEAVAKLRAGPWHLVKKDTLDLGPLEPNPLSAAAAAELPDMEGFIAVRDSQGVQIGDGCVQQNDFTYVCRRPAVNVHALLKGSDKVAHSLVDAVVNPPARETAESLNFAVKSALMSRDTVAAIPDRSRGLPCGTNVVRDLDGVSIGSHGETHEFKALMVDLRKPEILDDSVADEYRHLTELARRYQPPAPREPGTPPDAIDDADRLPADTLDADLSIRDGLSL